MAKYTFNHWHGQSMPEAHLFAADDDNFFKKVLPSWEKDKGFKHVPGTVICTVFETRKVPEPQESGAPPQRKRHHPLGIGISY